MRIPKEFPNTVHEALIPTSPVTTDYNCIAWAYGRNDKWYWPDALGAKFWPATVPRVDNVDAFIQLFQGIGYEVCEDDALEEGYEKIAIYTKNGEPKHAARQLPSGRWTSKLGKEFDVEHSIFSLNGGFYGDATVFMRREKAQPRKKDEVPEVSRNAICPCGSGKKYKRCHGL